MNDSSATTQRTMSNADPRTAATGMDGGKRERSMRGKVGAMQGRRIMPRGAVLAYGENVRSAAPRGGAMAFRGSASMRQKCA